MSNRSDASWRYWIRQRNYVVTSAVSKHELRHFFRATGLSDQQIKANAKRLGLPIYRYKPLPNNRKAGGPGYLRATSVPDLTYYTIYPSGGLGN